MANITKADMEQLLVELSPLPKYVGDLTTDMRALAGERRMDRESQIRIEETIKGVASRLDKINGSVAVVTKCAADNALNIGKHDERLEAMNKVIWTIVIPVVLMLVKTAIDLLGKLT